MMTNKEAVNWIINLMADIGKAEHSELWHYEQALKEIKEMIESEFCWTPVSDGLPKITEHHVSEVVICYLANGAYCFGSLEENPFGQTRWSCERDDEYHQPVGKVLAWMELPKPYSGGDSDE